METNQLPIDRKRLSLDNPSFVQWLLENGYFALREIEGVGVCGLVRMCYSVGVCVNIDWMAYETRFCFSSLLEALAFYDSWDGKEIPVPGRDGCTAIK